MEKQIAEEIFSEFTNEVDLDLVELDSINIHMNFDDGTVLFEYSEVFFDEIKQLNVIFDTTSLDSYKVFDYLTRIIYEVNSYET